MRLRNDGARLPNVARSRRAPVPQELALETDEYLLLRAPRPIAAHRNDPLLVRSPEVTDDAPDGAPGSEYFLG